MADAFLQQLVTCFLATVSSKVSTLIGSKLAFKSLHSTLPENPDVGFKSEVILFTCNNHHVTKYSCFHLAQSRPYRYTFITNSRDICSNIHQSTRMYSIKFANNCLFRLIIANKNDFINNETSAHTTQRFRFSRNSRQKVRAWLRTITKISED